MRIYQNFKEALSEMRRDLAEMGLKTHPKTYQDKEVENDPDFDTLEINNYIYTITHPEFKDLKPTQPWADKEFSERIGGNAVNPGEAFKERLDVWQQFLDKNGLFSYTYSERLSIYSQLERISDRIIMDPDSRQLYITVWNSGDITKLGRYRIPCSLGYYFKVSQGKLDMTYLQRSADFVTHLENDIYLARYLQCYIAGRSRILPGNFIHWIGSLHMFKKDAEGVF